MKKLEHLTEPELRRLMNAMGHSIQEVAHDMCVESPLFTLLLWNDPKMGQYLSNCERKSMIEALEETAKRLKANEDVTR